MTWLVWRQYRWQAAIAALLLAAFATALIVTGLQMASHWHSLLSTCANSSACTVSLGSTLGHDLVVLSLAVPVILGFLWGAPLVAHELETGTVNFAWAQSVTKARWLTVPVSSSCATSGAPHRKPRIAGTARLSTTRS